MKFTYGVIRAEIVCWVLESMRPFSIVGDRGFQISMKMGRPTCYIPLVFTVSHDVKQVFMKVWGRIANMLQVRIQVSYWNAKEENDFVAQEHDKALSFGIDAWTSPNHKAYVAVMVHFEQNGGPMCLLLDLVEVATSHSGRNLAAVFVKILTDFRIGHKVSMLGNWHEQNGTYLHLIC